MGFLLETLELLVEEGTGVTDIRHPAAVAKAAVTAEILGWLGAPLGQWPGPFVGGERGCRQSQILPLSGIGAHNLSVVRAGLHGLGESGTNRSREPTPMAGGQRSTISSSLSKAGQELGNRARKAPRRTYLLVLATATLGLAGGIGALNLVWAQADPERTGAHPHNKRRNKKH